MRDFWYTLLGFTVVGVILAAFIRFVFFLAVFTFLEKFLGIVALFVVLGLIAGVVAQRYKIVTRLINKFT